MAVRLLWPLLFMATAVRGATKRPFERMQQATGQADAAEIVPSSSMLPPVSSSCGATTASWSAGAANAGPSVAMLQSIMKNGGMDPIEAISMGLNSPGYKLLLESADIQRRLLDEMPVLKAFKPFKELAENKQATDEETMSGFAAGMAQAFEFMKTSLTKIKDPNATVDTLLKLAKSEDPHTQDMFKKAKAGDKDAVEELQRLFAAEHFPGVDIDVLKELSQNQNFDKLLGMDEIMRFIDRDKSLSDIFRKPIIQDARRRAQAVHTATSP